MLILELYLKPNAFSDRCQGGAETHRIIPYVDGATGLN